MHFEKIILPYIAMATGIFRWLDFMVLVSCFMAFVFHFVVFRYILWISLRFGLCHRKGILLQMAGQLASQIDDCGVIRSSIRSSQKNIKLSMFQFKRTITSCTTRDKFFKAKITDSGSCHVCELKQTVEHLFVECQHVRSFWNLFIISWWNGNNSPWASLTNNDKIYGYLPENRSFHTFNPCLIVSRFYIYKSFYVYKSCDQCGSCIKINE